MNDRLGCDVHCCLLRTVSIQITTGTKGGCIIILISILYSRSSVHALPHRDGLTRIRTIQLDIAIICNQAVHSLFDHKGHLRIRKPFYPALPEALLGLKETHALGADSVLGVSSLPTTIVVCACTGGAMPVSWCLVLCPEELG